MMRGQRQIVSKPKPKSKRQKPPPETDDEFLDHGVSLEEAAEKWQAGDSQKATRFYVRALETYDEGLKLFPHSADLTYNKARLQYSITQVSAIRENFPASTTDLLQTALQTHRQALSLDPLNADLLFNTAQVLNSLAEAIDDSTEATRMLQEAVAIFEQCLSRQELLMHEHQVQLQQPNPLPSDIAEDDGGVPIEAEEDLELSWHRVVEPVTPSSLVHTVEAMLETLSSICTTASDRTVLASVEELSDRLLLEKLPSYVNGLDEDITRDETACVSDKFRAAFSEARFRFRYINYAELDSRLQRIFRFGSNYELEPQNQSYKFLVCAADALISFAIAGAEETDFGVLRFKRLTKALECLSKASKSPNAKDLVSIHMARGDAEMLRFSVSKYANVPDTLSNTNAQATLLQNAEKFYKGAAATAQATSGSLNGITTTATMKQAVVECIIVGNNIPLRNIASSTNMAEIEVQRVINDMVEESIVQEETLRGCGVL